MLKGIKIINKGIVSNIIPKQNAETINTFLLFHFTRIRDVTIFVEYDIHY